MTGKIDDRHPEDRECTQVHKVQGQITTYIQPSNKFIFGV